MTHLNPGIVTHRHYKPQRAVIQSLFNIQKTPPANPLSRDAANPVSVNTWTRLAGFNRYEQTCKCQHLIDCSDNRVRGRGLAQMEAGRCPSRCVRGLAYQVRQVEVLQAVPRHLQQAG